MPPSFPPSRLYLLPDVTPLSRSGLMVVGHRLDCYSCFLLFSQFSSVIPGHGSLAQDILQSFTLIPDAHTSNPASCGTPSVEPTTVVISQSLSRTALNVSLSRYIAFVFRLLVCLVPSLGVMVMYQKALRAKVEDILLLISYIPHLDPHHPTYYPPYRLAHQSPSTWLRIAYFYRCLSNCCDFSCAGPHHVLGGPTSFLTP